MHLRPPSWDWGSAAEGFPNATESLRKAFAGNPYMRLYVASGYFDLATPYFATEYTLAHLGLEPTETGRISTGFYDAGHMMYLKPAAQKKLIADTCQKQGLPIVSVVVVSTRTTLIPAAAACWSGCCMA